MHVGMVVGGMEPAVATVAARLSAHGTLAMGIGHESPGEHHLAGARRTRQQKSVGYAPFINSLA